MRSSVGAGGRRVVIDPVEAERLMPQFVQRMTDVTIEEYVDAFNEVSPRYKVAPVENVVSAPTAPAAGGETQQSSSVGTFDQFMTEWNKYSKR